MIRRDLSERSAELRAGRVPFVHARVVLAEAPTSAKPGDEAIALVDGDIVGFVGGECTEAAVREAALDALQTGEPALLRVTPRPEPEQQGKRVVHNPCLSGGSLEIFLEPWLPPPLVLVVGESPIAAALAALGAPLGYTVRSWTGEVEPDAAAVVVASHGKAEDGPLAAALRSDVPYVGLVASRTRGAAVVAGLDVPEERRAQVHTPAGLDIGAANAEEVALSILAEIVASRPRHAGDARPRVAGVCTEIDPVCGMSVVAVEGTAHVVHPDPAEGGRTVWFCGAGCRASFLADPAGFPARS